MTLVWPHGDPRDVARAIVAEPRFRGTTAAVQPGPTLLERALAWVGARLHDVFHAVGRVLGAQNPLAHVLAVVLAIALLAAAVGLALRFMRLPGRAQGAARGPVGRTAQTVSSADLLAEAAGCARAERWHDAASALVRAALLALDETGRLRYDPARTAAEARCIVGDPNFDVFEREASTALFANGAATAERFARLRDAYAQTFGVSA